MRMPPLLANFIHNRVCELKCEKFLTRPMDINTKRILMSFFNVLFKFTHGIFVCSKFPNGLSFWKVAC